MKNLRCSTHGELPWELTICCSACGRVYQAVRDGTEFVPLCQGAVRAPEICECGRNLPKDTARAICTPCFKDRVLHIVVHQEN